MNGAYPGTPKRSRTSSAARTNAAIEHADARDSATRLLEQDEARLRASRFAVQRRIGTADSYGKDFKLTLWTNDAALAARADDAGVDRIGLDLETIGKCDRQPASLGTWISSHHPTQLPALRKAVRRGKLFCRINPIHPGSRDEINQLLDYGVQVMMLPMFKTPEEVSEFVRLVDGRCEQVLLLEHRDAARRVEEIVRVPGLTEVHVGLNDLTLSLNMANRFAVLSSRLMNRISAAVNNAGLRFGVGGLGRAGDNAMPIPSDLIYAQYPRINAQAALVARAFLGKNLEVDLAAEVRACRACLSHWAAATPETLESAHQRFRQKVNACRSW